MGRNGVSPDPRATRGEVLTKMKIFVGRGNKKENIVMVVYLRGQRARSVGVESIIEKIVTPRLFCI
jgi:hypothetical protein